MRIFFRFFFFFICNQLHAQVNTYHFEELTDLQNIEKRNVIIFAHADWCKYCAAMEQTIFKDTSVQKIINKNFWFISFDVESQQEIEFNSEKYRFSKSKNSHELTEKINGNDINISLPLLSIYSEDFKLIYKINSFLTVVQIKELLNNLIQRKPN